MNLKQQTIEITQLINLIRKELYDQDKSSVYYRNRTVHQAIYVQHRNWIFLTFKCS